MSWTPSRILVVLIAGAVAAGCSKNGMTSPSGPSSVSASLPAGFRTADDVVSPMAGNHTPGGPNGGNQTPGGPSTPRGPKVAGEGTVANISGECPTLTMVVRGVRVSTTEATTYEIGECGNLRAGSKVLVEGDFEADGSVTATSIVITDQPGGHPVAGEGTVGSLRGVCPALTMVVRGYPVMTTSSTDFVDGPCEDLHPGSRIGVTGDIFGNSVLASQVKLLPAVQ